MLRSWITTIVLLIGLAFSLLILIPQVAAWRLPGNQQGFEPTQPLAYSHRLHAGELQIPCLYCHFGAESSRHAGIPPVNLCMNCHRSVTAPLAVVRMEEGAAKQASRPPRRIVSPELRKLYDALGMDEALKPVRTAAPLEWVRVHTIPDFVYFDHRAHVTTGVTCQQCHGLIETMERVRQVETLAMGWCVNCHRQVNQAGVSGRRVYASIDCVTCHY